MCAPTDESLIRKYQVLGDIQSLEILFDRYLNQTFVLFEKLTRRTEDAQDLTQTVFYRIIRTINSGRTINKFQNFLFIACRNAFRDYLRQKDNKRMVPIDDNALNAIELIYFTQWRLNAIHASAEELECAIQKALKHFGKDGYQGILKDYLLGFSIKEVAARNDCSTGTAGSIWHRNKKKLLQLILQELE